MVHEVERGSEERAALFPALFLNAMSSLDFRAAASLPLCAIVLAIAACSAATGPKQIPDQLTLTAAQLHSLDSTGQVVEQANPMNANLKSFIDSTLLVLTAGVGAKRLDVVTDLSSAQLYFVGIHRVFARPAGGSFSTWNLIGMNDPSSVNTVVEVSGFAQSSSATAPTSLTGAIGDGTGAVHGYFLSIAAAGAVTEWFANTGSASFASGAAGAACPNFMPTATLTCSIETMHIQFSANASSGSQGASGRHATLGAAVDVPAMRLTYTF